MGGRARWIKGRCARLLCRARSAAREVSLLRIAQNTDLEGYCIEAGRSSGVFPRDRTWSGSWRLPVSGRCGNAGQFRCGDATCQATTLTCLPDLSSAPLVVLPSWSLSLSLCCATADCCGSGGSVPWGPLTEVAEPGGRLPICMVEFLGERLRDFPTLPRCPPARSH